MRGAERAFAWLVVASLCVLADCGGDGDPGEVDAPPQMLTWTYATSPEHLKALLDESTHNAKPAVVYFWGTWVTNCKVVDARIARTRSLRERFGRLSRIKVDLSGGDMVRWPMRHALGVEASGAPVMVFIDHHGRIRREADLIGLHDVADIAAHVDIVLRVLDPSDASGR